MNRTLIKTTMACTENPDVTKFNMHAHDTYEIYCFLSGSAKYFVEGNTYPLKPGDILIMKKTEAHSLLISDPVPYRRIVVSFASEAICEPVRSKIVEFLDSRPLGTKNRYPASHFKGTNWLYYLKKICEAEEECEKSVYLTVLLTELNDRFCEIKVRENSARDIMDIVNYINIHLSDELNLDIICDRFFISKAHINRRFKKIIGATVWEYISIKRLMMAKELLQKGNSPTEVYLKCGYKDYCTFFRAYKTRFGVPPKNDRTS